MKLTTKLFAVFVAVSPLSTVAQTRAGVANLIQSRELSYEKIAGYEPGSQVTDHNAIDKDQASIEKQIKKGTADSFKIAQNIYENGGHSKSYAVLTLDNNLETVVNKKDAVKLVPQAGEPSIEGKAYAKAEAGTKTVLVQYSTSDTQDEWVKCRVGALPAEEHELSECFPANGTVSIGGKEYPYTYVQTEGNKNGRHIKGFSTAARAKMYEGCTGCPFSEYSKYYNYYGVFDYANNWITAALTGGSTSINNFPADFSKYESIGRGEAAKKGTAYMAIYMYVIREFYDAIGDCKVGCINCNDDPVHAWDEGVAFYSGSLEGTDGGGSGKLLHQLADKRCANFKTCGTSGNVAEGIAKVNYDLFAEFAQGQFNLLQGNCAGAQVNLDRILKHMPVPLIQGTLRYAYKTDLKYNSAVGRTEKSMAEGAVFAAAVLPVVHACNADAAKTIADNMKVGATTTDFKAVKKAFESTYKCIGVTCKDVGGLFNTASNDYYGDASPCKDSSNSSSSSSNKGLAIGLGVTAAVVGVLAVGSIMYMAKREKSGNPVFAAEKGDLS